jgi:DNA invertase Pin-like site-specific DNA recombinase
MNSEKIQATHRERAACVYIRQSSMQQVRHAKEGQQRQYALEARARELGFPRVELIDDDLGKSGSGAVERPGFGRLLTAVCEGTVGAVFALEASRLARNNRDWHHLIDLCAMTNTLVIDEDGVYDPRSVNDRLLLGLKGSMAEFELGLLRQRAREALLQMIRRGLVLWEVAVGYVRTEDYRIEMNPDRQVQQAVRGVFAKFRAAPGRSFSGTVRSAFRCRTSSRGRRARRSTGACPFTTTSSTFSRTRPMRARSSTAAAVCGRSSATAAPARHTAMPCPSKSGR